MSLANDKKLIEQLLSLAQATQAAPAPTTPVGLTPQAKAVAQKLLQNLKQEAAKPASSFTADKGDIAIRDPKVLRNLPALLEYLRSNVVRTNGYSLVVSPDNGGKLAPVYQKYGIYSPYPKADSGEEAKYFAYKEGLLSFVRALQKQALESKNGYFQGLLQNLIAQINSDFADMSATETEKPKTYPADMQLDLLKPMISADERGFGTIKLTPPDLASRESLYNFLKKNNIKFSSQGKQYAVDDDLAFVINSVLEFMHARAEAWAQSRGSDSDKAYLELVNKLNPNAQPGQQAQQTATGKITAQQTALMQKLEWPLAQDRVDVDRIAKFLTWYLQFINLGSDSNAKATAGTFNTYLKSVSDFQSRFPGLHTQMLGSEGIGQLKNKILAASNGRETSAINYIQSLQSIVGGAATAIANLGTTFKENGLQDLASYTDQQNGFYQQNLSQLDRLAQAAQDDFRNIQRQNKGQ